VVADSQIIQELTDPIQGSSAGQNDWILPDGFYSGYISSSAEMGVISEHDAAVASPTLNMKPLFVHWVMVPSIHPMMDSDLHPGYLLQMTRSFPTSAMAQSPEPLRLKEMKLAGLLHRS
jgi:hypothetical protein